MSEITLRDGGLVVFAIILDNIINDRIVDFNYDKFRCFTFLELYGKPNTPEADDAVRIFKIIKKKDDYKRYNNVTLSDYPVDALKEIRDALLYAYVSTIAGTKKEPKDVRKYIKESYKYAMHINIALDITNPKISLDPFGSKPRISVKQDKNGAENYNILKGKYEILKQKLLNYKICKCGVHLQIECDL